MNDELVVKLITKRIDDTKDYIGDRITEVKQGIEELTDDVETIKIANSRQDAEIKAVHRRVARLENVMDDHMKNHRCNSVNIRVKAFFGTKKGKAAVAFAILSSIIMTLMHIGGI